MRTLHRLCVATAATVLAAGTALTGAGLAAAAPIEPEPDSPSTFTYSGTGEDLAITYKNRSGHRLTCIAYAGEKDLIGDIEEWALDVDVTDDPGVTDELWADMGAAGAAGKLGVYQTWIDDGEDLVMPSFSTLSRWAGGPSIDVGLTDDSIIPNVVTLCVDYVDEVVTYYEIRKVPFDLEPLGSADLGSLGAGTVDLEPLGSVDLGS